MGILQMSAQAGFFIIAIVIIRAIAQNKLPNSTFLVLWGAAIIRLLVPFAVSSPLSVYTLWQRLFLGNSVNNDSVPTASSYPFYYEVTNPAIHPSGDVSTAQETSYTITGLSLVWLVGFTLLLAFFIAVYWRNTRKFRFAWLVRDNALVAEWAKEHKLARSIRIMQSDRITSPVAYGVFRPRIILPSTMNINDEQLVRYVLTHEYCHIRRFDPIWKIITTAALCIHWFNPLVWVLVILLYRDLEITCDEMVVRSFGTNSKAAYAYALLDMAENNNNFSPLTSGFSKNATEERIKAIMKFKKSSIVTIAIAAFVVVSAVTVFATTAGDNGSTAPSSIIENNLPSSKIEENSVTSQPLANQSDTHQDEQNAPSETTEQFFVLENAEIRHYTGDNAHPYVHSIMTNNTEKTVIGYQFGMLAFDKDGNPLEIEWNFLDSDAGSTYFYLCDWGQIELAPGDTFNADGGWSLNFYGTDANAEKIAYVLYCNKEIEFGDGTIWQNPDFDEWRTTYEGNSIDVDLLESYYPFVQDVV